MSDVSEGAALEEAAPVVTEDAFAGEAAPEILVEGEGELRLRDFFALRLWPAALIPLLSTAVTSTLTAVRVTDAISPLGRGPAYEDLFFQAPTIPLLARPLLPFGLPLTTQTGYGYGTTSILQTNMLIGILALLIGVLLVASITRRTNDAIHVAGPYFMYSALCVALLEREGKYFQTLTDVFPALLGAVLIPLLVGLAAKIIATWMRNQGWLEADQELFARKEAVAEMTAAAEIAAARVQHAPEPEEEQLVLTVAEAIGDSSRDVQVVLRHVVFAKACPFCGNPKIQHEHPRSCSRCHRHINLAIEHDDQPCPHCGEALVTGAEFCHHCAMWLKGYQEPSMVDELGVA